ncbi:hypothetical protein AC579_903 [Pseudocercospora musae]|uniref:Uncharacterized protein n=1 Tax=Pseudocercospora musae TaxID=113226 RepID=A0A139INR9_9PEZI|nr:hypothetical protein AC579_903 [Pseudocercospora musae]
MARTIQTAVNPSPPASASSTHRVTKARSERATSGRSRMTRQRSRMLAEASSNAILEHMVNEAQVVARSGTSDSYSGKGKGRSAVPRLETHDWEDEDSYMLDEEEDAAAEQDDVCPIIDKDTKPFPIMDLPTEIRLEIYRACLTRPYNILLSKHEQQVAAKTDGDPGEGGVEISSDDEEAVGTRSRLTRGALPIQQSNSSAARRLHGSKGLARTTSRSTRPARMPQSRSAPSSSGTNSTSSTIGSNYNTTTGTTTTVYRPSRSARRTVEGRNKPMVASGPDRPQNQDPLIVGIMLASKQIYKEARSVLYGENFFTLDLATAMPTLACLHQRSRRQIKHVELEIPTYNEILERFQETVRLSLRYCSGLKKFVIHMPFTLPGADGSGTTGNTTVYANGFDILRWLPQECNVILQGNICTEIETVVNKHLHLAKTLDKVRQHKYQMSSNMMAESEEVLKWEEMEKKRKEAGAAGATREQASATPTPDGNSFRTIPAPQIERTHDHTSAEC